MIRRNNYSTWEPHHGFSVIIDRIWELPVKVLMEVDEAQLQNLEARPRFKETPKKNWWGGLISTYILVYIYIYTYIYI